MNALFEKKTLEFPLILALKGLPLLNGKKLDAVWRANTLPELYSKLKTYTNLNIELVLPEDLLLHNKYAIPEEDIQEYQKEENLALIRYIDELFVMKLELYTPPTKVLEKLLKLVCEKVSFYSVDSDRDSIISIEHKSSQATKAKQTYH